MCCILIRKELVVTAQELARAGKRVAYLVRHESPEIVMARAERLAPRQTFPRLEVVYGGAVNDSAWRTRISAVVRSRRYDVVILDSEGVLR